MQLHFTGRNIEMTPALKTFASEKFQRLERRHADLNIHLTFQVENVTHIAEATVHLDGVDIHAAAKSADMYSAIDELVDKLSGQITKHKEKLTDHR